jgi:hypothetical protein
MNRGKRIKPVVPIEYRLLITPKLKERERKIVTLVALRTMVEFTNFRYDIVVEPECTDRTLKFTIRGLRAPQVSLPGTGPAVFKTEYDGLHGTYNVIVSKHGKDENLFSVHISNNEIRLKKIPEKKFVEIVTKEVEWYEK